MPNVNRALVFSCVHFPYHDKPLWDLFIEFNKDLKPTKRLWIGDIFDFYQVSSFDKDPRRIHTMAEERDESQGYIRQMCKSTKAEDVALAGNHEFRMVKFLNRYPEFVLNLDIKPTWHSFLGLKDMGFTVLDFDGVSLPVYKLGHLRVFHGSRTNKHAVSNVVDEMGCSVMFGHTHRLRSFYKTTAETSHGAWEIGYLGSETLSKQYMPGHVNWQQGFAVVEYDDKSGWFQVQLVPVCKVPGKKVKRFMWGGTIYECKCEK